MSGGNVGRGNVRGKMSKGEMSGYRVYVFNSIQIHLLHTKDTKQEALELN